MSKMIKDLKLGDEVYVAKFMDGGLTLQTEKVANSWSGIVHVVYNTSKNRHFGANSKTPYFVSQETARGRWIVFADKSFALKYVDAELRRQFKEQQAQLAAW